ncbi:EmrB/QacA subfamily drug resistance transporter [Paenibacillus rhizosphaerae]|uniref:EmrB/QacA subfamily drug resistance transporter n=1 Tax=Paenibacillus rhizosphaerae TaxID=297318 RepID=A0A839TVC9_9BACL|nr:MFS transporter [Paenibacillus rhizosphaerae]MBB3128647.1 EmrB/QacA subfamily drug resistance transporter [Paenibacillus rhizosphaerae]
MKDSADQSLVHNESYLSIVLVAGTGMFLTTLDSGILNVAISSLVQEFHSSVTTVAWTISLYTIVICSCIVVFGRLSDRYGRLKIYSMGLTLFALASMFCAFSETVMQLILFRILQGIGAAMLQATSVALITTLVSPNKKGEALGALASFFGLGHVLGPAAGGVILSTVGWKWLFLMNIPICLLCLLACRSVLKGKGSPISNHQPLNLSGSLLLSASIFFLVYGCSQLESLHPGTYIYILIFAILMFLFIHREKRVVNPIVPLSLFKNGFFTISLYAIFSYGGVTRLCMVVVPYYLEKKHGFVPWQSGIVNLLLPLGIVLTSSIAGRLMRSWGTFRLMIVGLCCMFVPLLILAFQQLNWHLTIVCFMLFVYGLGAGLFQPSNIAAIMEAVGPAHQATIGSVQRLVQNVGISLFTAVTAGFLQSSTHDVSLGSRNSFYLAAAVTILGILGFIIVKLFEKSYRK